MSYADPEQSSRLRDAGERLIQRLSPPERAVVLLKEAFEMSLDEIAEVLETTTGAVKAALHHGRGRLREPEGGPASRRPLPSAELIDRFIAFYDARDAKGLAARMLATGSVENVGQAIQRGADSFESPERNILRGLLYGHADEWPDDLDWASQHLERLELEGRIARLRLYGFCPETMREIAGALGLRVLTGLYRPPVPVQP